MIKEVKAPDLGNVADAAIIEVAVKPGDTVNPEDTLITLESDKASMDIPAPFAGKVKELKVKVGDKISTGSLILTMETMDGAAAPSARRRRFPPPPDAFPAAAYCV
jgi:pyruvate/2-oxoglutarate dehydrogenase complex dihydrolipoamide acyltransferase (E2) component